MTALIAVEVVAVEAALVVTAAASDKAALGVVAARIVVQVVNLIFFKVYKNLRKCKSFPDHF